MVRPTSRLSLASDMQSVARLVGRRSPRKLEAPAATLVAVPVCEAETRGLPTPHRFEANEGADMAERTRPPGLSDSGTPASTVKITPAREQGPVTTTPIVA
jgi:hypothetical protein